MTEWFAWPAALLALVVVPVVAVVLRLTDRARDDRFLRVAGLRASTLADRLDPNRRRLRRRLFVGALAGAVLALARPQWGTERDLATDAGIDVLLCVDVSRSMLARDLSPDRLRFAKDQIVELAHRTRGDRLGLVVFAGEARLAVPLTSDMSTFAGLVDAIGPLSVRRGGTDLAAALDTALVAFADRSGRHEAVILLTDGEDLDGRGAQAAQRCAERGVVVHCIGIGSTLGSKITLAEAGAERFLRDASGDEVVTRMDPATLRHIAESTGGAFVDAGTNAAPLRTIYSRHILTMARQGLDGGGQPRPIDRFPWPLGAALCLWLIELGLPERLRRTRPMHAGGGLG